MLFPWGYLVLTIGTIYIEALCCAFVPLSVRPEHGNIHFPKKREREKRANSKAADSEKNVEFSFKK